ALRFGGRKSGKFHRNPPSENPCACQRQSPSPPSAGLACSQQIISLLAPDEHEALRTWPRLRRVWGSSFRQKALLAVRGGRRLRGGGAGLWRPRTGCRVREDA